MANAQTKYPFLPKTNLHLKAGQFFSFTLANARFACVRVLASSWKHQPGKRKLFLAGLMDWSGPAPAKADDLVACGVLDYAWAHVGILVPYGATIDGIRSLKEDGIVPDIDCNRAYGPEVLRNLANEKFAGIAKANSSLVAFEFERLGWTLVKELQRADAESEFLLEWQRKGPPPSINWEERFLRYK